MPQVFIIILVVVGAYLIGNVNFATLITKLKKQDIRKVGSGNPGTMNMLRNFGKGLGALTLFLDILKGAVPCVLGWFFVGGIGFAPEGTLPPVFNGFFFTGGSRLGLHIAGFSVIIGHVFPVFMRFKGGKGIASAIGVCAVAQPAIALLTLVVGVVFIILTKMGSLGSFVIISAPLAVEGFFVSRILADGAQNAAILASLILIFLLFSLTVFTHRKNIVKLFSGTESKTVLFGKNKAAKNPQEAVLRK